MISNNNVQEINKINISRLYLYCLQRSKNEICVLITVSPYVTV